MPRKYDQAVDRLLARLRPIEPSEMTALAARLDAVRECLAIPTVREGGAKRGPREATRRPAGSAKGRLKKRI